MNRNSWRIIKNSEEHAAAMARLIELASGDLQLGTDDFDEFELLGLLIEHYESREFPMDKPDPIEAIKFRMDQQGLSHADMKQYIGSASKVSEVLNRKRPLSLSMIRRLHDGLGIPADILIQDMSAIEWSLVDSEEEETTMTSVIVQCESAAISAIPYFSNQVTESYFSKMLFKSGRNSDKNEEKQNTIVSGFSLICDLSSSFTAANNLNDGMTSDGNYALVS
ncbi:transcriptional regulator [Salmonella enterica subsp. salamae]|uniref:Transcriptional regulator n=2 Tax=Salmonella enterica TaxID=28901 RepID=A0A8F7UUH7_SALER|nr:transcriptional regulator [Salmonella enterica]EBU7540233.1 transcriptional regulator [Salmonella enterica subsp. salamae serovar Sofia]EDT7500827.1 transcriptional regulator [Salmonella enterica subsp. enterica serovar Schleissheim]EBW9496090.1 transcriptional regulator [Salmonella enterica subsp. salamae serovar Sofia]EBX6689185.1 transcriptional regulator [Salmonella enterica subsp. salamae serovar Sofia]ECF6018610.1 transcriptional regulator [Salmonella enterica subsp. salamae serovar S